MNEAQTHTTGRDVRSRIISAADRLFYKKGYDATSISDIITEASVSRAGFYGNFDSKEELARRYLDLSMGRMGDMLSKIAAKSKGPEAFIRSWFLLIIRQVNLGKSNGCPLANFSTSRDSLNNPWQSSQQRAFGNWQAMLLEFFERWAGRGAFQTSEELEAVSRKILIIYEGALTLWKIDGNVDHIHSGLDLALDYLRQAQVTRTA